MRFFVARLVSPDLRQNMSPLNEVLTWFKTEMFITPTECKHIDASLPALRWCFWITHLSLLGKNRRTNCKRRFIVWICGCSHNITCLSLISRELDHTSKYGFGLVHNWIHVIRLHECFIFYMISILLSWNAGVKTNLCDVMKPKDLSLRITPVTFSGFHLIWKETKTSSRSLFKNQGGVGEIPF